MDKGCNYSRIEIVLYSCVYFVNCVFLDPADKDQIAGNRTRKSVERNVRSKRPTTSAREGLVHGNVEPIKAEQRLMQSSESRSSSSRPPTSERTSASPSTGTSDLYLKDTSNKNTDSAVVVNSDTEKRPPNSNSNSAVPADNLKEDTDVDLDEQSIFTYVFHY